MKNVEALDCMALFVSNVVLTAFVAVCLFSESNMPFIATAALPRRENGNLTGMASSLGMNPLLEHWAQAIHPPTLFVGYAGPHLSVRLRDRRADRQRRSAKWVVRATPLRHVFVALPRIGIGLGAIWAYVVLGWGGYWAWDPVENASLLSWMVALALVHSFTVYRQRGAFKRWSIMCACLTFAFVVVGTFITRSGIVQSVHAFEGDPVSLMLFGGLIVGSLLAGSVGLAIRRRSFGAQTLDDDIESIVSKDAAYYVNNLIM